MDVVSFLHIAVHNKPPYECIVYELLERPIQLGRAEYRAALQGIRTCLDSGEWTDPLANEIQQIDFPEWMYRE